MKNHQTKQVIGLAIDSEGNLIDDVPMDVATDKDLNYGENVRDRSIRSREGCFKCHGNSKESVSFAYEVPKAREFWNGAKPAQFLEREIDAETIRCYFSARSSIGDKENYSVGDSYMSLLHGVTAGLEHALKNACHACNPKIRYCKYDSCVFRETGVKVPYKTAYELVPNECRDDAPGNAPPK